MQKSKERLIAFYDVSVQAYTRGDKLDLSPLPLLKFMRQIDLWHQAGTCPQMGRNAAETIYLADIEISSDSKRVDLLINRSDRDASDSVYSNPLSNSVRTFPKNSGEGNDFSAHVVIELKSNGNRYTTALEMTPGLASGKIARFLNYLIRHCVNSNKSAYEVSHPNGSTNANGDPTKVVAQHKVELLGHPSTDFLQSLNGGVLESIEIVDRRKKNLNWDSTGNMKEVQRGIMLRVGPKANVLNYSRIKEAAALAFQKKYDEARIKFKTPNGVSSTVILETDTMQFANDSIYIKKEKISGFTSPVGSSSQRLNFEIVSKMSRLL